MLFDQQCFELFAIVDALYELAEEANHKDSGAVVCGLYAASYRLAGSGKNIADLALKTSAIVDVLGASNVENATTPSAWQHFLITTTQSHEQLLQKVSDHQDAVRNFGKAFQEDIRNDLMHLTSEIGVILEHPFVEADGLFHSRLQEQHDAIEYYVEWFYEMGDKLNSLLVLNIDIAHQQGYHV
jgi:hypothetical protein